MTTLHIPVCRYVDVDNMDILARYHQPEPETATQMTNTFTCEVKKTTHCEAETRQDCKVVKYQECKEVFNKIVFNIETNDVLKNIYILSKNICRFPCTTASPRTCTCPPRRSSTVRSVCCPTPRQVRYFK